MKAKDPVIRVVATGELLDVLDQAHHALANSRAKKKPDLSPLHALMVQIVSARARFVPVLQPPPVVVADPLEPSWVEDPSRANEG